MPMDLKDLPRPPSDNGRGLAGSKQPGWTGGIEGYDYWLNELVSMGIKWFKVIDASGDSLAWCERLVAAGIFPIVRILRKDPPPNDLPEPNPGHIGSAEEETIKRLIASGVRYFETNNEPDVISEWKNGAMPGDAVETAKLVALNWLFDARLILEMGGLPGLPAISSGGNMDLIGALVSLGRQDILLEGCWIAVHNYCQNHPLAYPDDPVNRTGQPLTQEQYANGPFASWTWWNSDIGRVDTLDEINTDRAAYKNPTHTIVQDHVCFREFEYYNHLAMKYLGRAIPILSTEGGFMIGRREDPRYPRTTPEAHRDQTVALYDFMQRQAPDYYFAATPCFLVESPGDEMNAWVSPFWQQTLKNGSNGRNGIPRLAIPSAVLGDHLPVLDAIKGMPNLARRLPGAQPAPPIQPAQTVTPAPSPAPRQVPAARPVPPQTSPVAPPRAFTGEPARTDVPVPPSPEKRPSAPSQSPAPAAAPESASALFSPAKPVPTEREQGGDMSPRPPRKTPSPSLLFSSLPVPMLDWDPRLDALNIRLELASVNQGQLYWKLIRAEYQGPNESDGKHNIQYSVQDEQGKPVEYQRVWQGWADDRTDATTNDKGEASIPLWASFSPDHGESGPYVAWVDGLPSDQVTGMGLPSKRQVNFLLTWRRVIA